MRGFWEQDGLFLAAHESALAAHKVNRLTWGDVPGRYPADLEGTPGLPFWNESVVAVYHGSVKLILVELTLGDVAFSLWPIYDSERPAEPFRLVLRASAPQRAWDLAPQFLGGISTLDSASQAQVIESWRESEKLEWDGNLPLRLGELYSEVDANLQESQGVATGGQWAFSFVSGTMGARGYTQEGLEVAMEISALDKVSLLFFPALNAPQDANAFKASTRIMFEELGLPEPNLHEAELVPESSCS